ncbi:MAG: FHA domain-containing protein [Candidatus Thiodiazotropha sp.]|nr:FHA domain-containing protein [Candidatus Thiodiazotropha sp.]MCM8882866.1 FHA domain-containing protein [Candidatus Thiodiazotropha sp.]MCM8920220.1 FHA domain-containing protein [Candidatus Thiodiazotropha sp.]
MPKLTLTFKGRVIDVFHLESETTHIGRNEDCTIPIDSLAIAPVQAVLTLDADDTYQLQATDEEFPVLVNHEKIEQTLLHHGDVIQIGKHTLSFAEDVMELGADLGQSDLPADQEPDPDDENEIDESKSSSGVLQIMSGDNFGRIIPLKRNLTRIGHAGGDCAMIARREDGYFISFLEGPNPPSINRQPIGDQVQILTDGDVIEVGGTQMQFHY